MFRAADEVVCHGRLRVAEGDGNAPFWYGGAHDGDIRVETRKRGVGHNVACGAIRPLHEELRPRHLRAAEGHPEADVAEDDERLAVEVGKAQGLSPRERMHGRQQDAKAFPQEWAPSCPKREHGTVTETAFDVFSVKDDLMVITRFGAGCDRAATFLR